MRLGIILACADLPAVATPPAHTGPPAHTAAPAHTAPAGAGRRAGELRAGELYVAPDADAAPGTRAAPLRTIRRAVDLARPGDTTPIRGGTHAPSVNNPDPQGRHPHAADHDDRPPRRAGRHRRREPAPHGSGIPNRARRDPFLRPANGAGLGAL